MCCETSRVSENDSLFICQYLWVVRVGKINCSITVKTVKAATQLQKKNYNQGYEILNPKRFKIYRIG